MEFWPADFREIVSSASTQKRRKGKVTYVDEQSLEPGSFGAAKLTSEGGHLKWITAVKHSRNNILQMVGRALEIYPSTKLLPPSLPRLSVHQRAEQGARFLRAYHPDVDIPFEIIKHQLQSEEEEAVVHSMFDPYHGNVLVHSSFSNNRDQIVQFLTFPSGEIGSQLNVAPFYATQDGQLVFSPFTAPAFSFDTPIQQIVAFRLNSATHHNSSLMAIRTHSNSIILKIQNSSAVHLARPNLTVTTVTSMPLTETGGHRVVDISGTIFSPSDAQVLLVNETGSVYSHKMEKAETLMTIAPGTEESEMGRFWRVVRRDINVGMRSSSKKVHLFDFRTCSAPSMLLFDVKEKTEYLTSIEAPLEYGHLMCFSTTNKIVWVDERYQKAPVLSMKHQRAYDRTLRADTVDYGPSPLTILSSSANALVTVYDVNYGPSRHIHAHGEPAAIIGPPSLRLPLAGFAHSRHAAGFNMFQLSSTGSLWRTEVDFPGETVGAMPESSDAIEWTADMSALATKYNATSEDIPPLGGREYLDANLRSAYEDIFGIPRTASEKREVDAEAVYQTLERMPFFWQDMDGSAEHMLLTFDVAFLSGVEPSHASRADFLTESLLSSSQGFVALAGQRVPIPRLISTVRWYHDLGSLPPAMVPNVTTRLQALMGQLREEALAHAATAEGMKRAIEAAQQLVLDLSLSRHVFAPQSFSAKGYDASSRDINDPNLLLQATEAMSLGMAKPPPVQFGHLHPLTKLSYVEDEQIGSADEEDNVGLELPSGVRLLLSQWEVGTDPGKYVYRDPYGAEETTPAKKLDTYSGGQAQHSSGPSFDSSQQAPPVVASSRAFATGEPHARTRSMVELGSRQMSDGFSKSMRPGSSQGINMYSSQEQRPSTQPLPGAFGGGNRPQRKVAKKRIGGF